MFVPVDVVTVLHSFVLIFPHVLLQMYATDALTKSDVKKSGLSPDGVMQMYVGPVMPHHSAQCSIAGQQYAMGLCRCKHRSPSIRFTETQGVPERDAGRGRERWGKHFAPVRVNAQTLSCT
jgi:hypothetical protein